MRKYLIPVLGIFMIKCASTTTESTQSTEEKGLRIEDGTWRVSMQLGESDLPFTIELSNLYSDTPVAVVKNQDEVIEIDDIRISHDSIILELPVFPSTLAGKIESPTLITGQWINRSKKDYSIPFVAEHGKDFRFSPSISYTPIKDRYRVVFGEIENDPWDAVLKLENDSGRVRGTFLTETGDYRYLEGNIINENLYLSTFDGSHAFYFSAQIVGDSLTNGVFLSGKHYATDWRAFADTEFELRNPASLTYLKEGYDYLDFNLPNQNGDSVSWNDLGLENKVVIVDIMGSWCPNCMDANKALVELTKPYSEDQVEILTLAFELTKDLDVAKDRIAKMNADLKMQNRDFLFAGYADKKRSQVVLPMLNHIMSFPTLIFIDKNRNIRQIYTGFYGPGTNGYYQEFMTNTAELLKEMTSEEI